MSEHDEVQGEALPEETVSHETGETPEVAETAESAPADQEHGDDAAAKKPKRGLQERINELVRQREEAAREARILREQLEARQQPTAKPTGKPDLSQYERYEDYLEALSDWKVEQRLQQQQTQAYQSAQTRELEAKKQTFQQRAAQFDAEDFAEVAFDPSLPVSDAMRDVILDSEKGPELLYHLGHNRAEAARIASLPPVQAARALGLLEAKLSLPQAKTVTAAPPPIKPVAGRGEPPALDPEKMTADEWREWRFGQLRASGRL